MVLRKSYLDRSSFIDQDLIKVHGWNPALWKNSPSRSDQGRAPPAQHSRTEHYSGQF